MTIVFVCFTFGCGGEPTSGANTGGTGGVVSDAGGDSESQDASPNVCEQPLAPNRRVRVCANPKQGSDYPPVDVTLFGPVVAAGSMNESSPCSNTPYDSSGFWFELADANAQIWDFGASIWGVGNPLVVGDLVSVEASRHPGGFSPTIASLTVRRESGALVAYAGEGGDTPDLTPPDGIVLERAQPICTATENCGEWRAYDLNVTSGESTKTVAYGTSETVGPYRVMHGGAELQVLKEGGTPCPDWYIARVTVGITPAQ